MNAKEAHEKATKNALYFSNIELQRILQMIKDAASKGKFSITVEKLSYNVKSQLKSLGYVVTSYNDIREQDFYIMISW